MRGKDFGTGPVLAILAEWRRLGIEVRADGERLRFRPKDAMPPDLAERLKAHKPAILAVLTGSKAPAEEFDVPDGWTREGWIGRLRYLASVCVGPGRAAELTEWADGLERTARKSP